jgi:hypothetical protein
MAPVAEKDLKTEKASMNVQLYDMMDIHMVCRSGEIVALPMRHRHGASISFSAPPIK